MFLLTEGPHLYYVDPDAMVLKGEIPWDSSIRPEIRDFKIFFLHTPNRVYYLIDPQNTSKEWCHAVEEVKAYYFGAASSTRGPTADAFVNSPRNRRFPLSS